MLREMPRLRAAVLAAAMAATSVAAAAPPAHAKSLTARIDIDVADMSARAYVGDDVFDGQYTAVLSAVGPVSCGLTGPQTLVASVSTDTGNPAAPSTTGTCANRYNGQVTYNLEWVGIPGTSGHLTRVCTITAGIVICSPNGTTASLPDRG